MHLSQRCYVTRAMLTSAPSATVDRMTVVTFLGHAGLGVRARGFRLLVDPWFARTGAFLGAWHQFPRNDHLDIDDLCDAEWVAVSHEHLDHMDLSVLTRLP